MPALAQVNVARMRGALDSPAMQGFLSALDPVYRMAEATPGFLWRLRDGHGHAAVTHIDGDALQVVNVSAWTSYEALHAYVYRSAHGGFVRRRTEWFLPTPQPATALWWVAEDEYPTADQALARLALLRRYGPTPRAFSVRRRFDPAGRAVRRAGTGISVATRR